MSAIDRRAFLRGIVASLLGVGLGLEIKGIAKADAAPEEEAYDFTEVVNQELGGIVAHAKLHKVEKGWVYFYVLFEGSPPDLHREKLWLDEQGYCEISWPVRSWQEDAIQGPAYIADILRGAGEDVTMCPRCSLGISADKGRLCGFCEGETRTLNRS